MKDKNKIGIGEVSRGVLAFSELDRRAGQQPQNSTVYSALSRGYGTLLVPALFIAGEKSPMWPPAHAEASAALCPKGSFVIVPGSGYAVNWEKPDEANRILLEFLAGL